MAIIGMASDHGGFVLKEHIKQLLVDRDHTVRDFGTDSEESVDYPEVIEALARAVATGTVEQGIAVCGTGIGASIVSNKVPGIRCALCHEPFSAEFSRRHNDANVLALGGRVIGQGIAEKIITVWLETPFDGGRHMRRVNQIRDIELRARSEITK